MFNGKTITSEYSEQSPVRSFMVPQILKILTLIEIVIPYYHSGRRCDSNHNIKGSNPTTVTGREERVKNLIDI